MQLGDPQITLPSRTFRQKNHICRIHSHKKISRIQILTEKYILRIPLSSDFLQIIGRKQIDGRIQKSRLDSKGLSAIESNSNLAKTLFEDYSFEG